MIEIDEILRQLIIRLCRRPTKVIVTLAFGFLFNQECDVFFPFSYNKPTVFTQVKKVTNSEFKKLYLLTTSQPMFERRDINNYKLKGLCPGYLHHFVNIANYAS